MERETGFEPATSTLARLHSTAELFPQTFIKLQDLPCYVNTEKKEDGGEGWRGDRGR